MAWIDFSDCERYYKGYDGADGKISIVYEGDIYMLKFPKKKPDRVIDDLRASYSFNMFSEHIGCRIFESVGIHAQETLLGNFGDKDVVACKDFIEGLSPEVQLQEFNKLENSYLDSDELGSARTPTIENIMSILNSHERLSEIRTEAIERYWDMFIVDAALGNFDRHSGNWGYLIDKSSGAAALAPVYDCGSCLYPQLADTELENVMSDDDAIRLRIMKFPLAALKVDGKKANYYDFINSLRCDECNRALARIYPKIDLNKMEKIIYETSGISDVRKKFYDVMVKNRIDAILRPAYERLHEVDMDHAKVGLVRSDEQKLRAKDRSKDYSECSKRGSENEQ